jgi:ABC-type bacteriocin/lantibiotic exporter with double-glycine peptidase domain
MKLLPSISKIVTQVQSLHHATPTLQNLSSVIEATSLDSSSVSHEKKCFEFRHLSFSNVSLEYPESGVVLDKCNLSIHRGDVVGVVGETGSGKSTLINIILGLVAPTEGQVVVNDEPIEQRLEEFTSVIGYVPQETYLVDESLYNNIVFFRAEDDAENRRLVEGLLEDVSLSSLVEKLEDGIDSSVGEQGCRLSGGQRQRVGIARALYSKPNILILDEATSALDKKIEQQIMELILKFRGETTIIMIAHRESTLQSCDYILKVSDGKVSKSLKLD